MFEKTRLQLTAWYLLIIMVISISFSVVVYQMLTVELTRVEQIHRLRQENQIPPYFTPFDDVPVETKRKIMQALRIDPEVITETKNRIKFTFFLVNLSILALSGVAGYFLAGRTLQPIKEMVDEQNRFIADASHELRTPLTALRSEIEVGLRDKNLKLNEARNLLESNLEEVHNLQYLSDNLIKLAQFKKGNNAIPFERVSTKEIITEAEKKLTKVAKSKKIMIVNQSKDIQLKGERQSLIELLVILLDNAIKYSDKNTMILINTRKIRQVFELSVADQGMGINKKDIPHLFDRFYRADESRTKQSTTGYGLGLAIAKGIVDKHKGTIRVESEIGKGSKFIVRIPLK